MLLEITLSDTTTWVISFVVVGVVVWLIRACLSLSREVSDLRSNNYKTTKQYKSDQDILIKNLELENQNKIKDTVISHQNFLKETVAKHNEAINKERSDVQQKNEELRLRYVKMSDDRFTFFKETETQKIQADAMKDAYMKLEQWKLDNTVRIRLEAINMSKAVILGKVTEHLIPFMNNFPYNHKDVRFIGSPIDLIVFDGCSDDEDEIVIYIIEVKTGTSKLSKMQQKIKIAVNNKRIVWQEIHLNSLITPDTNSLL